MINYMFIDLKAVEKKYTYNIFVGILVVPLPLPRVCVSIMVESERSCILSYARHT